MKKKIFLIGMLFAGMCMTGNVYAEEGVDNSNTCNFTGTNGTVKLEADCTATDAEINKKITIDLNGHKITNNDGTYVLRIKADGVTITDSSSTPGSIEGTNRGILISEGSITIDKVIVKSADRTIQINPEENKSGLVTINSGVIESNGLRTIMLWGNNKEGATKLVVNGGTITAPFTKHKSAAINLGSSNAAGNSVTINGGHISGYNGIRLYGNGHDDMTVLTMNNGTITASNAGIIQSTETGTENTNIYLYGGTITAEHQDGAVNSGDSVAVYHGQAGTLVIGNNDGTGPILKGETGISIKKGDILIQGGEIDANGEYRKVVTERTDGTEDTGAALSVTTNSESTGEVTIKIKDGKLTSENGVAFYEGIAVDEIGDTTATRSIVRDLEISGGTFDGANGSLSINSYTGKGFITGGTYSNPTDAEPYLAEGYIIVDGTVIKGEKITSEEIKTDPESGVTLTGSHITEDSELFAELEDEMAKNGYTDIFDAYELEIKDGSIDPEKGLTLTFEVGKGNNNRKAFIIHKKADGTYETFDEKVENGEIKITVTELSPFMVALGEIVEDPKEPPKTPEKDDSPKTGEEFTMALVGAVLAGATGTYAYRKLHN